MLEQAKLLRQEALERALASPDIREPTRRNMVKIDKACCRIHEMRGELSTSNVLRVLAELFPGDHPAESSIRNNVKSGQSYQEVIALWRTYQLAIASTKRIKPRAPALDDLPDIILNQLQPEGARMVVLSMRTALRNMRQQTQIIRAVSPDRLIRHQVAPDAQALPAVPVATDEEREILAAFVDSTESASRGLDWDDLGRLLSSDGEPLSRPGLRDVIKKLSEAPMRAPPSSPAKALTGLRPRKRG